MTAAKVMDTITSRLPGCSGQAADAVSAFSQVKMEDAPTLLKVPKSECPGFLLEHRKDYQQELQGNLMQKSFLLGPTTGKVMQRNAWAGVANLRIKRLNNFSKSQHHAWMTINLKKRKTSQWEN